MKNTLYLSIIIICLACQSKGKLTQAQVIIEEANPASDGFNIQNSDQSAINIADQVMIAMGGIKAWNNTRYISWKFFNSRKLWWDKWTGDVRVESLNSDLKILVNIHDLTGKVYKDGVTFTNTDSLDYYLKKGKSMWINDAYWLVMPYKLKDSGITLKSIAS